MGAGIGFVRDAQNNAKRNRDNLKHKANFTQTHKVKTQNKKLVFKESTSEEIAQFKASFLRKQKIRSIKDIILFTSILVILLTIIWYVF